MPVGDVQMPYTTYAAPVAGQVVQPVAAPAMVAQPVSTQYPTMYSPTPYVDAGSAYGGGMFDAVSSLVKMASDGMNNVERMIANAQVAAGDKGVDPAVLASLNSKMSSWSFLMQEAAKINQKREEATRALVN